MQKLYVLIFSVFFFPISKAQTTVTLSPSADNTIYADNTGNSNGNGPNFTAGANSGLSPRRALIQFNLSGIPTGSVVTSVTLRLTLNKTKASTDDVSLYKLNSNWGEGGSNAGSGADGIGATALINDATWICKFADGLGGCTSSWSTAGGDFNSTPSATTTIPPVLGNYTWGDPQMVADVQSWINTPSNNYGWIIRADEATIQTVNRFDSKEGTNPPRLSVTYNNPIPVKLISFKAQETKIGALLNWETAQEFNNAFFLVEHSLDGINFSSIGKVNGHGTTALPNSYSFKHEGVEAGQHYYRLAQTDINGRVNHSFIVSVNNKTKSTFLQVSPNPVINTILLQGSSGRADNTYSIFNQAGIIVLSGVLKNNQVNVQGLVTGNYFIRVQQQDGTVLTGRFLKQ